MVSKQLTKSFFKCPCCGKQPRVNTRLLKILNAMQKALNAEFAILHPTCKDLDFKKEIKSCVIIVPKGYTVDELADLAISFDADGIKRLYKYKSIYIDVKGNKMDD